MRAQLAGLVFFDRYNTVLHGDYQLSGYGELINQSNRRITMFNGVRKTHFELFLKECEWRYNRGHEVLETELRQMLNDDYIKWQRKGRQD